MGNRIEGLIVSIAATTLGKPLDSAMANYYVDTTWLKQNLDKVVILDARKDSEYKDGHIPGAINVTWQSLSNMQPKQGQPGWGVVLPQDKLAEKLGSLGIDGSKPIVVYNDPLGLGEEGRVLCVCQVIKTQKITMHHLANGQGQACR